MDRCIFLMMLAVFICQILCAQTHYQSVSSTGNNATIGIPFSINLTVDGNPLEVNDEIAVFADGIVMPDSFCVGVTKWTQSNSSITVWGDNEQTLLLDGIKPGSKYRFRIWKASMNKEYVNAVVRYSQGDSLYKVNGISIVSSITAGNTQNVTAIGNEPWRDLRIPKNFVLSQNYPNPFNPTTAIRFGVPVDSKVKIEVYSVLGQLVSVLLDEVRQAGYHKVTFGGQNIPSGVYFFRITAGLFVQTKKMQLIK
jgi:hypothetical protein